MVSREPENFEDFYQCYRKLAFSAAYRILRHIDDAEDVVQHVFFKAWSAPERFQGGNVESWLTTLAKNRAIDILRKKRRDAAVCAAQTASGSRDAAAPGIELSIDLNRALRALTPGQRDAVTVCFYYSFPHAQAARVLGLPVGTLKTRVRAGVRRMRGMHLM